jgi:integrase
MACYKAIAEGIIPTNPVNSTKLPAYHKKEACIPSEEEVNNLLKIAEEGQYIFYDLKNDNSYKLKDPGVQYLLEANKVIVLLAITSGMRLGELFGLTWNNVDFANNSVSVTHTLTAASTGTCLGLPKTFESIRTIPLPHQTINKLQGWKKYQGKYAQNLQDIFVNKNNLVFPNSFGNFMSVSNWHVRYWKKMMGVAGWKGDKNPHILRHLYISTLIRNKIPILYVAKIAGHTKSALITLKTYAHVIEAQNSEMAGAIDKIYALKTPNANSTQSKIEKANG